MQIRVELKVTKFEKSGTFVCRVYNGYFSLSYDLIVTLYHCPVIGPALAIYLGSQQKGKVTTEGIEFDNGASCWEVKSFCT